MRLVSTHGIAPPVSFCEAVERGIAPDGGLYTPAAITPLPPAFFASLPGRSLVETGVDIARHVIGDEVPGPELRSIVEQALDFPAPLRSLTDGTAVLELFHGPTLAFKDFGARFMARTLAWLGRNAGRSRLVLVATSGDTGSAVAHAFSGIGGFHVALLYPSGKISPMQEQQLTTVGGNVTAFEVSGTFDDCQRLVKQAFADPDLQARLRLTSANSINIARLLPQSFYYAGALAQVGTTGAPVVFSVPSGNLGNLTAGLMAWKLGLPVRMFIAAVNANRVLPDYLETGRAEAASAIPTIANAMDVGDPSNLARLRHFFDDRVADARVILRSWSFSDDATRRAMRMVYERYGYIIDPHGAVGFCGLERWRAQTFEPVPGIVLGTAHPAKFLEVLEPAARRAVEIPDRLKAALEGTKRSVRLEAAFPAFKELLLHSPLS